eukprot:363770-Chlamydomonas_euryale.AAC.5
MRRGPRAYGEGVLRPGEALCGPVLGLCGPARFHRIPEAVAGAVPLDFIAFPKLLPVRSRLISSHARSGCRCGPA